MGLLTPFWMKDYSGNSVRQRKKSMERIRQGLSKIDAITDEKKLIEIAQKTPVKVVSQTTFPFVFSGTV